jgi:hypothetical protein
MTEEFLQYIWKHRLFEQKKYIANTGETVEILHTGDQNTNAGPDFSNVRIRIAETLWAGNCEVHVAASDWSKHAHSSDPSYNNIILHVVLRNDAEIKNANGNTIPAIELKYPASLDENYKSLLKNELWIPCAPEVKNISTIKLLHWLTSLSIERLEKHSNDIQSLLLQNHNHWEDALYISLARSFGFGMNGLPFQMLAKSLPFMVLAKHKDNLFQIEALLFGQSGLIAKPVDEYSEMLLKEYVFLQKKYSLKPIESHLWKFLRLRPSNFPTIRIAQFAAFIKNSSGLFAQILDTTDIDALFKLFTIQASAYWDNHYSFGKTSQLRKKQLTTNSINIILINAVIPFIFVHGKLNDRFKQKEKAIYLLEQLSSEKNSIIENWNKLGIQPSNAFESQALIELKNEYCNKQRCLHCGIGLQLIAKNA